MEYNILSLGAGIQSTTIAGLIHAGELPPVECGIFADTGWEPKAVYENLDWLEKEVSFPIVRVKKGDLKADYIAGQVGDTRYASMPVYVGGDDAREGKVKRQCSQEYKIEPINAYVRREILGLKPRQRIPKGVTVNQWIGISIDELRRVRASKERWRQLVYPLIGLPSPMLSRPWSRAMCIDWLTKRYPGRTFPRSACIGCPQHDDKEWGEMKRDRPAEFAEAVAFERFIQEHPGQVQRTKYLHRSCQPLDTIDFSLPGPEQGDLFRSCMGVCDT